MSTACPSRKMAPVLLRLAAVLLASATSAPLYAQVTAISTLTNCRTPVLTNPAATNPLRIQAGTVEFEAWGSVRISTTTASSLTGYQPSVKGISSQTVSVVTTRSATQNSGRNCPAQPSVVLRVQTDDALAAQASSVLRVPVADGTTQQIGLTVLPHPNVSWIWSQTPVGQTQGICTVPSFDHQYVSGSVLKLTVPFDSRLGLECKQRLGSRLVAGNLDAHITGPIPVRLTTELTNLQSSQLPVPISPESMPTQLERPRTTLSVPIALSKNGVLRGQRDFPLQVTTPNGKTASLTASIVRAPQDLSYSILIHGYFKPPEETRAPAQALPTDPIGVLPSQPFDVLFSIDPAVREFALPITWRLTNSACFSRYPRAGSISFNPASTFQSHSLAQGATFFEVVLVPRDTAACVPAPGQSRDETLEVWTGTDTSRPPAARVTVRVVNPSS
jgi:hypothetical protein